MADLYYYEEGYIEASYFSKIAEASAGFTPYIVNEYFPLDYFETRASYASLVVDFEILTGTTLEFTAAWSAVSSLSVAVGKIVQLDSTMVITAEQTSIISRTSDIDLFAFTDAALAAEVQRIRDNNISASAAFNVATDARRYRDISSEEDAAFEFSVVNARSRAFTSETQAAFSFDLVVTRIQDFDCSQETTASLAVSADRIRDNTISNEMSSTIDIDNTRVKFVDSSIVSASSVFCVISHIEGADIIVNAFATLTVDTQVTSGSIVNISSTASSNFIVGAIYSNNSADLQSYFVPFVSRQFGTGRPNNGARVANGQWNLDGVEFATSPVKFGTHSLKNALGFRTTINGITPKLGARANQAFVSELWYYTTQYYTANGWGVGNNSLTSNWWLKTTNLGAIEYYATNAAGTFTTDIRSANGVIQLNSWNHILIVAQPFTSSSALGINDVAVFVNGNKVLNWYRQENPYAVDYGFLINALGANTYIDDVSYHRGSTLGYSTTASTITVPTTRRENNQFTQLIWRLDNNGIDDLSMTQTAIAGLSSTASLVSSITGPQRTSATLTASASMTATVGTVDDIDLTAFGSSSLTASISLTKQGPCSVDVESTQTTTAVKITNSSVSIASTSTVDINYTRLRFADVDTDVIASELIAIIKYSGNSAELSSSFDTTRRFIEDSYYELGYFETSQVIANYLASARGQLAAEFTSTIDAEFTTNALVSATSTANFAVSAVKITENAITASSEFTSTTQAVKIVSASSAISVNSTLEAIAVTNQEIALFAFTNTTLTTTADLFKAFDLDLNAAFDFTAETYDSLNSNAEATVNASSALTLVNSRIRNADISCDAITVEMVVGSKTAAESAELIASSSMVVNGIKIAPLTAALNSSISISASPTIIAAGTSHISSAMTAVMLVKEIRIDEIVYIIPAEGWNYKISVETRQSMIHSETRLHTTYSETRQRSIADETREYIII